MIARLRGEHDNHPGGWRPTLDPQRDPFERPGDRSEGAWRPGLRRAFREPPYALVWRSRGARWLALLAVAVVGLIIAGWSVTQRAPVRTEPSLPATPRAWLDAYEAAAIDNPPLVCSQLFSPALAATYATRGPQQLHHLFRADQLLIGDGRADPAGRWDGRARAAPNARPQRLGGRPEPSHQRLAGGRPARRPPVALRVPARPQSAMRPAAGRRREPAITTVRAYKPITPVTGRSALVSESWGAA